MGLDTERSARFQPMAAIKHTPLPYQQWLQLPIATDAFFQRVEIVV